MADYGQLTPCDIGRECHLQPTEGHHNKAKHGVIIDETKTLLKVRVSEETVSWAISKKDMLRTGAGPCYKLSFKN